MHTLFIVLIMIAALLMIDVALTQESKGGGLSPNFSSSNAIMDVRRTIDLVEKTTRGLAIAMVIISVASVYVAPPATIDASVVEKAALDDNTTNPNNLPNLGTSQQKQAAPAVQAPIALAVPAVPAK